MIQATDSQQPLNVHLQNFGKSWQERATGSSSLKEVQTNPPAASRWDRQEEKQACQWQMVCLAALTSRAGEHVLLYPLLQARSSHRAARKGEHLEAT